MKKILLPFIFLLSLNCMSQELKTNQNLQKINGEYKVLYNGAYFDVDTTLVTVKHKNHNAINNEYKVLLKNKLGYVHLGKPAHVSLEDFVAALSQDEMIETIMYGTYGELCGVIPNDPHSTSSWHLPAIKANQAWDITMGEPKCHSSYS